MRILLLAFLMLSFVQQLDAASPEEEARTAAIYVQARQFEHASEIYHSLLSAKLPDWQRSIVLYNVGVILLYQQRWEEAIKAFDAVPLNEGTSPLLLRRYYYDLAIALLGYAQSQEGLFSVDDPSFVDRFRAIKGVLQRAKIALNAAEKADCELIKLEGAETCAFPIGNKPVQERIKELLVSLNEEERGYQALQRSVGLRLAYLLVALGEEQRWMEQLSSLPDNQSMWQVEQRRLQLVQPWWNSLRLEDLPGGEQSYILAASKEFEKALKALNSEGAKTAALHLRSANYWLRVALQINCGGGPETLLQVRVLADGLGETFDALDTEAKKWLFAQLPAIEATEPGLAKQIEDQWSQPQKVLQLYQVSTHVIGALLADAVEHPRTVRQLLPLLEFMKLPPDQAEFFETAINGPPNEVSQKLLQLAARIDPMGFIREQLIGISVRYSLALAHRTLQTARFSLYTTTIEQLKHFIELPEAGKMAPVLTETIGLAMTYHTYGIKALDAHNVVVARILFGEALYWLCEAQKSMAIATTSPEGLLKAALEEQRHAMTLVSSVMELPADERHATSLYASPLHEAMRQAQEQPAIWAQPFVQIVLQNQKAAFHALGSEDVTCQKYPWEEVMPLYFLGETASDRAAQNLGQATSSLSDVLTDQKVAYRKWLKALELLKERKTTSSVKKSEGAAQNREDEIPGVPTQNPSTEDTLRLLQQMDREDRKKSPIPQPIRMEGGKPW